VTSVEAALAAIGERAELNAVVTVCADEALARAASAPTGPLAGVPLLVKDLLDTAGIRTTYGSSIYAEHMPDRTAPAVARLEAAGALIVGKANLDEFAWGVTGQNVHWGDVANPRRPGRIAGGSSAGSAAGLAAGMCDLALGSDTGGSIRMPSACCGTVGFKPSLGTVATEGCYPLCPSFDTVGPMARTVRECALAYSVLTDEAVPQPRLDGRTIGVLTRQPPLGPDVNDARDERALAYVERLEALGARVREIELPVPEADVWPVFFAEAVESHRATFPSRRDEYGPTIRTKLDAALETDPAGVEAARRALGSWRARAAREPDVDLVLSPTLGVPEIPPADVDELEIRLPFSAFTRPFSYLGWAAIAIGELQLAARDDATVLAAALAWEDAYGAPA
jgi:aspartyl-tRNA(Asn)/glutamyl-tRNA(Gln) amidotransferase subunit A